MIQVSEYPPGTTAIPPMTLETNDTGANSLEHIRRNKRPLIAVYFSFVLVGCVAAVGATVIGTLLGQDRYADLYAENRWLGWVAIAINAIGILFFRRYYRWVAQVHGPVHAQGGSAVSLMILAIAVSRVF